MKTGYSVKAETKKKWKKFYFTKKLKKVFGELPFWSRIKFVFTGKI